MLLFVAMTGCGESKSERAARIEKERQDSIARVEAIKEAERKAFIEEEKARKQDSINAEKKRIEQLRQDSIQKAEEEREAKTWKGVSSLSQFKSKLPGTTWGATDMRGDFYYKFHITHDKVYIEAYLTNDFDEKSQVGKGSYEDIDRWYEDSDGYFTIKAYSEREMERKRNGHPMVVPTQLCFKNNSTLAIWATLDGGIKLKQIIE